MRQILDLHIHSCYSRACSRDLVLSKIDEACRTKGINIIATGDYTYPDYLRSIKEELEEVPLSSPLLPRRGTGGGQGSGLYKLKTANDDQVKFILSTEFALIYKKNDKVRRIHMCVMAPNLEAAAELHKTLDADFNVRSDGRPILGMSIEDLIQICLKIHPDFIVFPAHIWTPWFSIFGSKSGFDSLEEAFGDQLEHIFAYETGLSSDAEMNWRVSQLDGLTLLSNSDAHSLKNLAREANIWEMEEISFPEIRRVLKERDAKVIDKTIEFYPEEGMYHYDGHRTCGVVMTPAETKKHQSICPKCKKPMVVGVDYRVDELADRKPGFKLEGAPGYVKLVELDKIIAEALGLKSRTSKKVMAEYERMIKEYGPELEILLDAKEEDLEAFALPRVAEGIKRVRQGNLHIEPGFDGQYGVVKIFSDEEKVQKKLI